MRIPTIVIAIVVALGLLANAATATATANTAYRRTPRAPETTPTFTFGHAHKLAIERADLALTTTTANELRGSLRLTLTTWDEETVDRSLLIAVPAGTEVTELRVVIAEEGFEGALVRANVARDAYEQVIAEKKDPALLEWVSSSAQRTWLRLRVFPVTPKTPARVSLGFTVPRTDALTIDPGAFRIATARITIDDREENASDLAGAFLVAVPAAAEVTSPPSTKPLFVSRKKSLVAGAPVDDIDCTGERNCLQDALAVSRDPILLYY